MRKKIHVGLEIPISNVSTELASRNSIRCWCAVMASVKSVVIHPRKNPCMWTIATTQGE